MFKQNLKALRKANNMSLAQLSSVLGVSESTVKRWESGEVSPTLDKFMWVVRFFGTTPNAMLGWKENVKVHINNVEYVPVENNTH